MRLADPQSGAAGISSGGRTCQWGRLQTKIGQRRISGSTLVSRCRLSIEVARSNKDRRTMKLTILDPGHFHAALVQKNMYANVDSTVHVYAPAGPDLDDYLRKIESYNAQGAGPDPLARRDAHRSGLPEAIRGRPERRCGRHRREQPAQDRIPDARGRGGFPHARRQADGHRHSRIRSTGPGVHPRAGEGGPALRHHDRAPRNHDDAAKAVLDDCFGVRRTVARAPKNIRPSPRKAFTIFPSWFPACRSSGRRGTSTRRSKAKAWSTSRRTSSTSCNGSASRVRFWTIERTSGSRAPGAGRPKSRPRSSRR